MKRLYLDHFEELLGHFDYDISIQNTIIIKKFDLRFNSIIYVIYI